MRLLVTAVKTECGLTSEIKVSYLSSWIWKARSSPCLIL